MLNFSDFSSNATSRDRESNFRKAGEVFSNNDDTQGTTKSSQSNYDKWMSYMNGLNNEPSVKQNPSTATSSVKQNRSTATSSASAPVLNNAPAVVDPNNRYNNKNADGSFKSALHESAEGQGYDQDAALSKKYAELDTYINNYKGPKGFSDDSNLDNMNDTAGRANNVMTHLDFQNKLAQRKQIQRQLNMSQGLDADINLPSDPQWYQDKAAAQKKAQDDAIAERAQNGGKLARPEFKKGSNKLTDYPEFYAKSQKLLP